MEEIKRLLDLDFDPEGLFKDNNSKDSQLAWQHKEMIEKAEVLLWSNKELEWNIKLKEERLELLIEE